MFGIRPFYDDIQAYYHLRRKLAVDERVVATNTKNGMT